MHHIDKIKKHISFRLLFINFFMAKLNDAFGIYHKISLFKGIWSSKVVYSLLGHYYAETPKTYSEMRTSHGSANSNRIHIVLVPNLCRLAECVGHYTWLVCLFVMGHHNWTPYSSHESTCHSKMRAPSFCLTLEAWIDHKCLLFNYKGGTPLF
jgi:hypothetical protein